jgi:two-component system, LytTR family, response regulator LytT
MIRTAIVEDEALPSKTLKDMLDKYASSKNIVLDILTFSDGEHFLDYKVESFDVVFMDINLPGKNGMSVAKELRKRNPYTILIFVTDLAQFAIKGYEVDAMDFLVKPVNYEHLSSRLDKIINIIKERDKEIKIQFRTNKGIVAISPNHIRYLEVIDHTLILHLENEVVYASGSLNEMENKLSQYGFSRCNHCYLVNLAFVTSIAKYTVHMQEDSLIISRNKKKQFLEAFTDYLGKHN